MKTRKFLIFAALLPLLLLLAGCGEKQAFNPVVFVAERSADSLTNAAGERLQGDPELGFDNDATTMEFGELYATQLYITHLVAYEIPRTTSLTLHSQYNPVIESASTEFLLHSDAVECRLDATYAEDGDRRGVVQAARGRHGVQPPIRLRLRGQDDADHKGGRFAGGHGHIPERKRRHPVGHGVYAPPVCTRQRRDGAVL